jgi:hypothetical protein
MDMAIGSMQSGVDGVWSLELVGVTRGAPLLRIDSFGFWIHSFTVLHGGQRRSKSNQVKSSERWLMLLLLLRLEWNTRTLLVCAAVAVALWWLIGVIDWLEWRGDEVMDDGWSCYAAHWIELKIFSDVLCCSFCFGTARVQCVMSASVCLSLPSTDIFHFPPNFKWNILYISSKAIHAHTHLQSNLYGGTVFHTVLCTRVRYGTRT